MSKRIEELDRNFVQPSVADGIQWYNALDIGIEGRGWSDTERPYDRLPARAKGIVREPVWELSHRSAGMAVRFVTDATEISARWSLLTPHLGMDHMPATGVSGLDLYTKYEGVWRWCGTGRPSKQTNQTQLTTSLFPGKREYLLYLPLYNGIESLDIGLPIGTTLTPARKPRVGRGKPVVFYGTSIVQGGCASRSGMGYPEQIGRMLDCQTLNLGFSGNGPMDLEMGPFVAELDASVYVIDCLPNMRPEMVPERCEPFMTALRKARPKTPIVIVENITYQRTFVQAPEHHGHLKKNEHLKAAYRRLIKAGVKGLHYVPGRNLLGTDGNGTVDGTHPTDVGFMRMAKVIGKAVEKVL